VTAEDEAAELLILTQDKKDSRICGDAARKYGMFLRLKTAYTRRRGNRKRAKSEYAWN